MRRGLRPLARALAAVVALAAGTASGAPPGPAPEDRALGYLAREVPRWSRANKCFSCHNNGDAARALYAAVRLGRGVPPEALLDTSRWLSRPEGWDHNGGDGPSSDKRLARVQFAWALADAVRAGRVRDRGPLERAARRLADDQAADGSWPLEGNDAVGSPATYGRPLLTFAAREALRAADPARYRDAIDRADRWLLRQPATNTPDATAVLSAAALSDRPEAGACRRRVLDVLRKGQSADGGWGPFPDAPPEPFDTAVALLALNRLPDPPPDVRAMITRGRAYLAASQNPDGSWPETTRPPGGESYAQRLSTTGWATLALLAGTEKRFTTEHTETRTEKRRQDEDFSPQSTRSTQRRRQRHKEEN
jgi:hypothetical protein